MTKDLVFMFEAMGLKTGVKPEKLIAARALPRGGPARRAALRHVARGGFAQGLGWSLRRNSKRFRPLALVEYAQVAIILIAYCRLDKAAEVGRASSCRAAAEDADADDVVSLHGLRAQFRFSRFLLRRLLVP